MLIIGLVLLFFMAWNLGANDAASPCGTPVGTGVISIKRSIILFYRNTFRVSKERNHIDKKSATETPNNKVKFEVYGEEMIEKDVKMSGNSGRVYLPPDWVGHRVKIIRVD